MRISACILSRRGLIKVSGADRLTFLQGLVSNDVSKVAPDQAIYALLLSPQGRIHYDLIIYQQDNDWYIEADADRLDALVKRLTIFKLRAQVTLDIVVDKTILSVWGGNLFDGEPTLGAVQHTQLGTIISDPRLLDLGFRLIIDASQIESAKKFLGFTLEPLAVYQEHRYRLGVPESSAELEFDRAIPLEYGMGDLHAIDWNKGCYMGQELTARTHYRGLIRKRAFPVQGVGIDFDNPIMNQDKEIGQWIAHAGDWALAMIRLESIAQDITCAGKPLTITKPTWMLVPETHDEA